MIRPPLPRPRRPRHVPVRAAGGRRARGCARRASRSSTSAWASRARRRRRSSARRWRTRSRRSRRTRARSGCRSCGRRSRAGRGAASASTLDPDTEVIPTLGSKEAVFGLAHVFDGDQVAVPAARLPGLRPRRARSPARRSSSCRCARRTAGCRPGRRRLGPRGDPVAQLPEQPDGRDRPARVLRGGRGAGARARVRARLRRGLLGALLRRRGAGLRAAGRATARTSPCSTRCPSARRCPATARASSPATRRSSPR